MDEGKPKTALELYAEFLEDTGSLIPGQVLSRSVQRRRAIQAGLPIPEFDKLPHVDSDEGEC